MRAWWLVASVAIGCPLLSVAALGQETGTWAFRDGHWTDVPRAPTTQPVVDEPAIDQAERLLFQGDYHTAKKILLAWEKTHKKSPARDRCIFLLAEVFYQSDNRIKSFYYCDELMDEYPSSALFQAALQKQFDIASAYLGGYKDRLLFMRILDEGAEAVEMMWRIQQRAPGSPLAEKAMLRTADYYFGDQQYDLAEDVYNAYVREYPSSPEIPRVKLQAAFSSLAQFRGVKFDATSIIDARTQLLQIQKQYPDLALEENVATLLEQIDSAFARKILEQGEFYERTYEIRGAVYEYRFLAQVYPTSPEAAEARQLLSSMPAYALAEAAPPPAAGYAPVPTPTPNSTNANADVEAK